MARYINNSINNTCKETFTISPTFSDSGSAGTSGLYVNASFTQTGASTSYYAMNNQTTFSLAGAVTSAIGLFNNPTFSTSGAVTAASGLYTTPTFSPSASTISTAYGSYIGAAASGAGTVTNLYSLYVATPTGGSNAYTAVLGAANTTKVGIGTATPLCALNVVGGFGLSVTAPAAGSFPYTVLSTDSLVEVSDTSSARTVNLPTPVGRSGQVYIVKDSSGGAATNNITVTSTAAGTIDGVAGAAGVKIAINYGYLAVFSDGTNYVSFSKQLSGNSFPWVNVSGASASLAPDTGYYVTNATLTTLTLPASASISAGQRICITGTITNTAFYQITQNALQKIYFGNKVTTTGAGTYLVSTSTGDSLDLVYLGSDTFQVLNSIGTFSIT